MNLPTKVVLYVIGYLQSMWGDVTAMDVARDVNKYFHSGYDWHEFSDLLDHMARHSILIEDAGRRNADGMVRYKLIGTTP